MAAPDLTVRTYDPKMVCISFGATTISGYADGTFVKVTPSGESFSKKRGADGSVERVNKNAFDYTVELTLMQTSSSNTALSILLNADKLSNAGVLPFIIKDLLGQTLFSAPQAWIAQEADMEDGGDLPDRTWTFHAGPSASVVGGN